MKCKYVEILNQLFEGKPKLGTKVLPDGLDLAVLSWW
jgi:hypothetical protein